MSRIFVSYTRYCITPQLSKFKAHDDPGLFDEATINMIEVSLVIPRCNITFSVFRILQGKLGNVATLRT